MHPVAPANRYVPLDVLRGAALFGVLLVNTLTLFRTSLFAHILALDAPPPGDRSGQVLYDFVNVCIEFKAFTLFSFLFGAGIALQMGRGATFGHLLRRYLVLLVIGVLHLMLVWNGDILALYAVCGLLILLLIPSAWLGSPYLALLGIALVFAFGEGHLPLPFLSMPDEEAMRRQAELATQTYPNAGYFELLAFRWNETVRFIGPLLYATLPRTLGAMLLGISAWQSGLLAKAPYPMLFVTFATAGIVGTFLHVETLAIWGLSLAYAAAVFAWVRRNQWLAAAGQMALTNYLMQSIVCSLVFYGYGLGQFGSDVWSIPVTAGFATTFFVLQAVASRWWLGHFYFGPAEWLWRSGTYVSWQPFRK